MFRPRKGRNIGRCPAADREGPRVGAWN
jgi:hypothetical protein